MDEGAVRSDIVWRMGKMHSVVLLLALVLICPGRLGIAHAKDVSSIDSIDRRGDQEIPDPVPHGIDVDKDPVRDSDEKFRQPLSKDEDHRLWQNDVMYQYMPVRSNDELARRAPS